MVSLLKWCVRFLTKTFHKGCFSYSREWEFKNISRHVDPNHGGVSLDTNLFGLFTLIWLVVTALFVERKAFEYIKNLTVLACMRFQISKIFLALRPQIGELRASPKPQLCLTHSLRTMCVLVRSVHLYHRNIFSPPQLFWCSRACNTSNTPGKLIKNSWNTPGKLLGFSFQIWLATLVRPVAINFK